MVFKSHLFALTKIHQVVVNFWTDFSFKLYFGLKMKRMKEKIFSQPSNHPFKSSNSAVRCLHSTKNDLKIPPVSKKHTPHPVPDQGCGYCPVYDPPLEVSDMPFNRHLIEAAQLPFGETSGSRNLVHLDSLYLQFDSVLSNSHHATFRPHL